MTAARIATPTRKPQRSDGIDLMHAVVALAYCDLFLVRDGFLRNCCVQAIKTMVPVKLPSLHQDAEALRDDLGTKA